MDRSPCPVIRTVTASQILVSALFCVFRNLPSICVYCISRRETSSKVIVCYRYTHYKRRQTRFDHFQNHTTILLYPVHIYFEGVRFLFEPCAGVPRKLVAVARPPSRPRAHIHLVVRAYMNAFLQCATQFWRCLSFLCLPQEDSKKNELSMLPEDTCTS